MKTNREKALEIYQAVSKETGIPSDQWLAQSSVKATLKPRRLAAILFGIQFTEWTLDRIATAMNIMSKQSYSPLLRKALECHDTDPEFRASLSRIKAGLDIPQSFMPPARRRVKTAEITKEDAIRAARIGVKVVPGLGVWEVWTDELIGTHKQHKAANVHRTERMIMMAGEILGYSTEEAERWLDAYRNRANRADDWVAYVTARIQSKPMKSNKAA